MVIITGLGRCGTSILTKYLKEIGYGIGKNVNWYPKIRAGYELSSFYPIVDDLYQYYCRKGKKINLNDKINWNYWQGKSYREALKLVDKDHRQGQVDIVKDPRITWHPDIIEAIWEARKDIKLIICHRDMKAIHESRLNLPEQFHDPKPRIEVSDYQVDFAEFYTRVLKLDIPHKVLFFPNFLLNHSNTLSKLYDLGLTKIETNIGIFINMVDKDLLNGT